MKRQTTGWENISAKHISDKGFYPKLTNPTLTRLTTQFFKKWAKDLIYVAAATAKSLQSCPTLCDPRDGSPPGSAIPGILQARALEWVAIAFSNT